MPVRLRRLVCSLLRLSRRSVYPPIAGKAKSVTIPKPSSSPAIREHGRIRQTGILTQDAYSWNTILILGFNVRDIIFDILLQLCLERFTDSPKAKLFLPCMRGTANRSVSIIRRLFPPAMFGQPKPTTSWRWITTLSLALSRSQVRRRVPRRSIWEPQRACLRRQWTGNVSAANRKSTRYTGNTGMMDTGPISAPSAKTLLTMEARRTLRGMNSMANTRPPP